MQIPDFMPILSAGSHRNPKQGACFMEMASFLAGEEWSDHPSCTHPVIASMARVVNDRLGDADRQRLAVLIPSAMDTPEPSDPHEARVLSVRLACWSARQVLDLAHDRTLALAAIEAAEGWCEGRVSTAKVRAAYAAAAYAHTAYAAAAAAAAHTAYAAAAAAHTAYAAAAYAHAAHAAAAAAHTAYAAAADLVALLDGLIAEYDRLTGRTQHPEVTPDAMQALAAHVA